MEEFCKSFTISQDCQIESLLKALEEFKVKYKKQDELLKKEHKNYVGIVEASQKAKIEMAEEVRGTFNKIDEYLGTIERLERVVENAERDLQALEEYCVPNK